MRALAGRAPVRAGLGFRSRLALRGIDGPCMNEVEVA
jgi:hypothetical protein